MWSNWNSMHYSWEHTTVQPLWKEAWQFHIKLDLYLPYDQKYIHSSCIYNNQKLGKNPKMLITGKLVNANIAKLLGYRSTITDKQGVNY
jgi:hypothetical protein